MNTPQASVERGTFSSVKSDFLASIVVFLVALPLCMGIAIASGVPVAAGLITGIVGGLLVGILAGSPLQVSGPAAGLTVIVFEFVRETGWEMLGLAVLIGGTIQFIAGLFRLGQWFRAVSPAVIQGMLAGIGVLIFASQFHVMVDDKPKGSGIQNLITIPQAVMKAFSFDGMGPLEVRRSRIRLLREVGELHRKQTSLAERVAEQLPDHASPEEWETQSAAEEAAEVAALQSLVPRQEAIVEELDALILEVEKFEAQSPQATRRERVLAAAHEADAMAEVCLNQLRAGELRDAVASQYQAATALEDFLNAKKNHGMAAQLGILTIVTILLWQGLAPKKLRFIPAPLVAIVLASAVALIATMPVLYVEVPDNLWQEVRFPTRAILMDAPWPDLLRTGVVLALVASAETLLCATAVDSMHRGPKTKYDKELLAQGLGNMTCGIFGALPMTGVIVRSSANVQAGAKTRLSAILHGFWLLIFVVFLSFLLRSIPTSSLAALLVYTGYKLVNVKSMKKLRDYGWSEVAIYAATVSMIVITDLLTGVIVGVLLTAAKLLYIFSHLTLDLRVDEKDRKAMLNMEGSATFLRLPRLAEELEKVPDNAELHVDLTYLDYIDHACLDLLMKWAEQHKSTGGDLIIDWESLHGRFQLANPSASRATVRSSASANQETPNPDSTSSVGA